MAADIFDFAGGRAFWVSVEEAIRKKALKVIVVVFFARSKPRKGWQNYRGPDRASPPVFQGRRAEALRDHLCKNRKRLCDQLCHLQTRRAAEPNAQRHFVVGDNDLINK